MAEGVGKVDPNKELIQGADEPDSNAVNRFVKPNTNKTDDISDETLKQLDKDIAPTKSGQGDTNVKQDFYGKNVV